MARKITKYDTPNAGGWAKVADDLFLAQFRGRPCVICGKTHTYIKGVKTRSMAHHIAKKELCRLMRYDKRNIIVLCADHHNRFNGSMSPHSECSVKTGLFYEWLINYRPDLWDWVKAHYKDNADNALSYKEAYIRLGGEITDAKFIKDHRPLNHSAKIRAAESNSK